MGKTVVLCADAESLHNPALLGLAGENLPVQPWLEAVSDAHEARRYLRGAADIQEVWVASSNEMDPINLAAALKRDTRARPVYLLAAADNGSLRSRAATAGIDGVIDARELANRYALRKAGGRTRAASTGAVPNTSGGTAGAAARQEAAGEWSGAASDARPTAVGEPARQRKATVPVIERVSEQAQAADVRQRARCMPATGRASGAYVLTVASASGGTGKSTIAVLSALIAQSLGYRTLLLDADMQFGDAAQLLSAERPLRIDQVAEDPLRLGGLAPQGDMPALLAAPSGVEDAERIGGQLIDVLAAVRERFDVVVVNTGSFWLEQHVRLLEASSNTLFLVDQRPTSLKATKRALELCARCGVASAPFLFAVNRCARSGLLTSLDISCALNGAKVVELKDGGAEVEELMGAGLAPELPRARNELCLSLEAFLVDILPQGRDRAGQVSAAPSSSAHRFLSFRRKRRRA